MRRWLPTIIVALIVAGGTWVARDMVPSRPLSQQDPSDKKAAPNTPSTDKQSEPASIPQDVNSQPGVQLGLGPGQPTVDLDLDFEEAPKANPQSKTSAWDAQNSKPKPEPSLLKSDAGATPLKEVTVPETVAAQDPSTAPAAIQADLKVDVERPDPPNTAVKMKKWKGKKPKFTIHVRFPATYLTSQNDSFWRIAKRYYDNPLFYRALYHHNRRNFRRPDRLTSGSLVSIPSPKALRDAYPRLCPKD